MIRAAARLTGEDVKEPTVDMMLLEPFFVDRQ